MRDKESDARVKLAGRILFQMRFRQGRPVTLDEVAQLRFFAESDAERAMPVEQLAQAIIDRERKRIGYPPPDPLPGRTNPN